MSYIDITAELVTILKAFTGSSGIEFGFNAALAEKAVFGYETSNAKAYPAACVVSDLTTREPFSTCQRLVTFNYSIIVYFERTSKDPVHEDIELTMHSMIDDLIAQLDNDALLCSIGVFDTQVTNDAWGYLTTPAGRSRTCTLTLQMKKKFKKP